MENDKNKQAFDFIIEQITSHVTYCERTLTKFVEEAKNDPTRAMRGMGEEVVRAQWRLNEYSRFLRAADDFEADPPIVEWLEERLEQISDDLLGTRFGSPGSAPWRHNSTCAVSNIVTSNEVAAQREFYCEVTAILKHANRIMEAA